jgi:hypothetical protein
MSTRILETADALITITRGSSPNRPTGERE